MTALHPLIETTGDHASRKRTARLAGVLYLIVAVFGAFAHLVVRAKVYVPGDAAETTRLVADNASLVRWGAAADLLQATAFILLALTLSVLLRHVHAHVARIMVVFVAISTAIIALNMTFQIVSVVVATGDGFVEAFGVAGRESLTLLMLDLQFYGYLIAGIFFALWLIPLGFLAKRSGLFPPILGTLLMLAPIGYLVETFTLLVVPDVGEAIAEIVVVPPGLVEMAMVLYLLFVGVRKIDDRNETPTAA